MMFGRGERTALGALALLLVITAGWWALALWPVPGGPPDWLQRARLVCFGATDSGLPDASGWLLLVGQPLGMLGLLLAGWGGTVRSGLAHLLGSGSGRAILGAMAVLVVGGLGAAGVRVARASEATAFLPPPAETMPPPDYPRLDRTSPPDQLVDQHGRRVAASDLAGRPALVTFAFGHCTTLCPLVVRQVLAARELVAEAGGEPPAVAVVTLDPWRDTPARLPHLAEQWGLPPDGLALSGEVDEVNAALDAWGMTRSRDLRTGDLTHPPLVFVLDPGGTVAYASTGGARALAELVRRAAGGS
ncbi:MAG TPA: SCO family protein [Longimicrobiales bacterium]|nr:SCO family protein [Longimicrobiales bacterium]